MAAGLLIMPQRMPARDRNGRACTGWVRVYQNQTLNEVTVYTDASLTVALAQPVTSDASGVFPTIWYDGALGAVTMAYEGDDGQTQSLDDLTASSAAIYAALQAYSGAIVYDFTDPTADADPGAGNLRFNNATLASVTYVYADNLDADGNTVTGWLDSFDDANDGPDRGRLMVRSMSDPNAFALFKVTGDVVDGAGYRKIPVVLVSGAAFTNLDSVVLGFSPSGAQGNAATIAVGTATALASTATPTATNGGDEHDFILNLGIPAGAPPGVPYLFDTTTGDADPGNGKFRLNNATLSSVTAMYIDNQDAGGSSQTAWIDTWDDGTSTEKGILILRQSATYRAAVFAVTGSVVDGTGYRKLTVSWRAGATLFSNGAEVGVDFRPTGNAGSNGTLTGPGSSTANAVALWNGTAGTTLKDSAILVGTGNNNLVQLDGSAKLPAVDGSQLTNVGNITRDARTTNTQLAAADKGKLIEITGSGGITQTFAAAATLGAGWFVYYVNNSTGDVTLDPNSTETIGGVNAATTAVLKSGQATIIECNASALYFADNPTGYRNSEIFTSSGTFTPKPGVPRYFIRAVAGGGNGAYGGGAAGGYAEGFASITSPQTVTIGAAGGATSVGSILTCNGGAAGAASNGGPQSTGGSATFSGGLALKGADGGGHDNGGGYGGAPGASPFGGAGASSNASTAGTAATANSGSGGGGSNGAGGGAGGSGLVIFYW